jgi:uncharacterized membrane protein YdjX (TVP38/TMEM64 family)
MLLQRLQRAASKKTCFWQSIVGGGVRQAVFSRGQGPPTNLDVTRHTAANALVAEDRPSGGGFPWRIVVAGVVAAGILAALFLLPTRQYLVALLDWIRGLGMWGPIAMVGIYVVACVLFLPGSLLTLGAGFGFGLLEGTVVVSIGSVLGVSAAFFLGRTVARPYVERWIASNPRFQAIDRAVAEEGFKIVLLTRLSPVFPFNLLNYGFGVTRVSFRDYLLASWIGMLPGTVMYVYFGTLAKSLADLAAGRMEGGKLRYLLLALGLCATVAVTVVIARVARRALHEAIGGKTTETEEAPAAQEATEKNHG